MDNFYLLYSGFGLLTTASLMAIWMDHLNPTEDSFKNFFLRFFYAETKTGILQRIVLVLGVMLCILYFVRTSLIYYLLELFIIFFTVGITSSLFKNFELSETNSTKSNLSIIGKIHLVLISIGLCGTLYAVWQNRNGVERSELNNAMDVTAHLVTFIVSVSALLGETASGGKLTKQGRALIILILVFSSISILTSLDTSEKQGQLNEVIRGTKTKAEDLGKTLDTLKGISDSIKLNLKGVEESVQRKIKDAIDPVRDVLDANLGPAKQSNQGRITLQLISLAEQLNIKDTSFTSSVMKIANAEKALNQNETFIRSSKEALDLLTAEYTETLKQYTTIITTQNIQLKHTVEAIGIANTNLKDLISKYEAVKHSNDTLKQHLVLSKSIEELISKTGADSVPVSEIRSLIKK